MNAERNKDKSILSTGRLGNQPPSVEEFEKAMRDNSLDTFTREHAFYSYWLYQIHHLPAITRADLKLILAGSEWRHAVESLIGLICKTGAIGEKDVTWLQRKLSPGGYAEKQLNALKLLRSNKLSITSKAKKLLELKGEWAILHLFPEVSSKTIGEVGSLIANSGLPRRKRQFLLNELNRIRQSRPSVEGHNIERKRTS